MRIAKDASSGKWVHHVVAICTLKDGCEPTANDDEVIDPERYNIEYTGESQYTGCTSECGAGGCGDAHMVDISHIYTPEQRRPVPALTHKQYVAMIQEEVTDHEQSPAAHTQHDLPDPCR